jgi:glutathione S-transferase
MLSNFYNVVKWAMLIKGIPFEEVSDPPSKETSFLEKSPMGKIPFLETEDGYISESLAILTYVEKKFPTPALFPAEAYPAAQALQIHQFIDCYIDGSARPLFGAAFFGGQAGEEDIEKGLEKTRMGFRALARVAGFTPFISGPELTHADLAAGITIPLASATFKKLRGIDLREELPGFSAYMDRIEEGKHFQKVMEDQRRASAGMRSR